MRLLPISAVVVAACGGHSGSGMPMYNGIEIEPAAATLTVPLGGTTTQPYQVFGIGNGGTKTEITSQCALTVDTEFGTFAQATLTALPHGGKTQVAAMCGDLAGNAELVINLTGSVVVPGTPGNAPDLFGMATAGTDASRTPSIQYPIDQAVSPRNIPPIEVQWAGGTANDLFHIALRSSFATVDVYTTKLDATLAQADWDSIIGSAAGDTLAFTVEALAQAAPDMKFASPSATITVSRDIIDRTAIYYWASSQGNIMSQTFGDPSPPGVVKNDCTSCHSVSRNGSRIGYSRCVANDCNSLYAGFLKYDPVAMTWSEAVNANDKAIHGSYTTFAPVGNPFPTDAQSAAIVSMADGTLALYDPDTGAPLPSNINVATHGPASPRSALMADWSPDGTKVVFASTPHPGQWIDLTDSSIAIMSYTYTQGAHVFGEPTFPIPNPMTLPNGSFTNFFFPSFSPDGALIVLNAARATWRNFADARTAGQRLMLADGNGTWVRDLTALNGGFVDNDITWAHWAPTVGSDYYWIVFSSERDYGHEITATNTAASCVQNGVRQCKQIWIAGIAKNKLTGTMDPSAPPMWLPGQDPKTDNISPYWSRPAGLQ